VKRGGDVWLEKAAGKQNDWKGAAGKQIEL
jgi:hypothetical protein